MRWHHLPVELDISQNRDPIRPADITGFGPAPPALYIKDNYEYFEIEEIRDSRCIKNQLQYLIKWKGYPESDNL